MLEKIVVVAKESKNIQPGNAELARKGQKCTNEQIYCIWCLSTMVNVYRDITHSNSTKMFGE
jgi:hypothetical protein